MKKQTKITNNMIKKKKEEKKINKTTILVLALKIEKKKKKSPPSLPPSQKTTKTTYRQTMLVLYNGNPASREDGNVPQSLWLTNMVLRASMTPRKKPDDLRKTNRAKLFSGARAVFYF